MFVGGGTSRQWNLVQPVLHLAQASKAPHQTPYSATKAVATRAVVFRLGGDDYNGGKQ